MRLALAFCLIATPGLADTSDVIDTHILPRHQTLVAETAALAESATQDCTPEALRPAFHSAYDAWIGISHIQFGPIEDQGLSLAMAFWPDTKNATGKAIARLTAARDPIIDDPESFPQVSVAAQGFTALELLLYEPQPDGDYACQLTRAIATGLARKATELAEGWVDHAALLRNAGANTRYQSEDEAERAVFTSLSTGLEFLHDQRLGRPLGTFDRPRPRRAEAWRSERSLRHVEISLEALENLTSELVADTPRASAAFERALDRAQSLDDPGLQGVADPASRFRIEALQQAVADVQLAVGEEVGKPLGITAGFNSLDGD